MGWLNWKCGLEPRNAHEHVRNENDLCDLDLPVDDYQRSKAHLEALTDRLIDEHHAAQTTAGVECTEREAVDALGSMSTIKAMAASALLDGSLDSPEGPFEDGVLVVDDDVVSSTATDSECSAEQ